MLEDFGSGDSSNEFYDANDKAEVTIPRLWWRYAISSVMRDIKFKRGLYESNN